MTIKKMLIVGGGTAGWSAAALLANHYRGKDLEITLVESPDIQPVGVGEATVPAILNVHNVLKLDEREFLLATQATLKLGIQFRDWENLGSAFFHPFSDFGIEIEGHAFHQCWSWLRQSGQQVNMEDYSLCVALAKAGRFALPDNDSPNPLAWYGYAYHFDASLYAQFLKKYAEKLNVKSVSGTVGKVHVSQTTGMIEQLLLQSGDTLEADFFVDCTGFSGLLIEGVYKAGFEDWSDLLPCDRAIVAQTASADGNAEIKPFTTSTAMSSGWRWEIPLKNRIGNGYVYASEYIDDAQARAEFLQALSLPLINEPREIRFKAGMRKKFWIKNCAAVGLSSGFIEPLESTSISLMHTGVDKIVKHLPNLQLSEDAIANANKLNQQEYERIRDFIILHYIASNRRDSPFWRSFQSKTLPAVLEKKLQAFENDGTLISYEQESFRGASWLAMYNGFNRIPSKSQMNEADLPPEHLTLILKKIRAAIEKGVACAPTHAEFLATLHSD